MKFISIEYSQNTSSTNITLTFKLSCTGMWIINYCCENVCCVIFISDFLALFVIYAFDFLKSFYNIENIDREGMAENLFAYKRIDSCTIWRHFAINKNHISFRVTHDEIVGTFVDSIPQTEIVLMNYK